ncbi:MAG: response regulator transcription factor [Bryobacterales bacterium]|nr:response regulator transcription factor [Bryobacterales bacterium]
MRILLADDHGIVRRGMRSLLDAEPGLEVVGEAANGREALKLLESLRPDMAILDVSMPLLNGIEVATQAMKAWPDLKIIMLSMYSDEAYVVRALSAGARGYLLKEATEEDLLPAVRAVAAGRSFFSPAIASILLADYVRHLKQRGLEDSYDILSDREKEVLQLLAEGKSNKEAAGVLNLSLSTVETHRLKMMQKLGLHNTAEIVLYAVRKGIIA